jgi:hypothetical protein
VGSIAFFSSVLSAKSELFSRRIEKGRRAHKNHITVQRNAKVGLGGAPQSGPWQALLQDIEDAAVEESNGRHEVAACWAGGARAAGCGISLRRLS